MLGPNIGSPLHVIKRLAYWAMIKLDAQLSEPVKVTKQCRIDFGTPRRFLCPRPDAVFEMRCLTPLLVAEKI